jgi:hypothetical protein
MANVANLYIQSGYVVVDLENEGKRDILFSVDIARWAAENLERLAAQLIRYTIHFSSAYYFEPTIEVQSVVNNGIAQVRIKFGRWLNLYHIKPAHAIRLAKTIRQAADFSESKLRDKAESNPGVLL